MTRKTALATLTFALLIKSFRSPIFSDIMTTLTAAFNILFWCAFGVNFCGITNQNMILIRLKCIVVHKLFLRTKLILLSVIIIYYVPQSLLQLLEQKWFMAMLYEMLRQIR